MRKKIVSVLLAGTMAMGMLAGCGSSKGSEGEGSAAKTEESGKKDGEYDLTLYSINTTDPDFDGWLENVEEATGLNINVIAAPTDSDTRQQKVTTILSTGDDAVDIIEINDEMSAAFKNSGWLEGLNDTVMTEDVRDEFAKGYVENMITDKDGNITVEGLFPATYTITEQSIDRYEPQQSQTVTLIGGKTTTVNFNNTLKRGSLEVIKRRNPD